MRKRKRLITFQVHCLYCEARFDMKARSLGVLLQTAGNRVCDVCRKLRHKKDNKP